MGYAYHPIDEEARSGRTFCLRADDGTLHSGRWSRSREAFVYGRARDAAQDHMLTCAYTPIPRPIVAYCTQGIVA